MRYPLCGERSIRWHRSWKQNQVASTGGREQAYQLYLFAPEAKTDISFENPAFSFFRDMYFDVRKHRGGAFKFGKHFLGPDNVPYFSGKEGDGGEEFQCAQMFDSLNEVEFWIRNVSQHENSFRLPVGFREFLSRLRRETERRPDIRGRVQGRTACG